MLLRLIFNVGFAGEAELSEVDRAAALGLEKVWLDDAQYYYR